MKITDTLPGPPLSPPDDPPECDCARVCDNPMPYLRRKERKDGTVECPECGGTGSMLDSLKDCENCEDGRVVCRCECHGGGKI